jgi:Lipoxygenase
MPLCSLPITVVDGDGLASVYKSPPRRKCELYRQFPQSIPLPTKLQCLRNTLILLVSSPANLSSWALPMWLTSTSMLVTGASVSLVSEALVLIVINRVEKMFNECAGLPDISLTPIGNGKVSDEESLKAKRELYQWSTQGNYPPHLRFIPTQDQVDKFDIFDEERFNAVQPQKIKEEIGRFFGAFAGLDKKVTMAHIEDQYRALHAAAQHTELGSVYTAKNVGLRSDWHTDAVFAQQYLTGVNPTGLKRASQDWIDAFTQAAGDQGNDEARELLGKPHVSFYVVDNSDYRYILGLPTDQPLINARLEGNVAAGQPAHGCASVTLFTLSKTGKLHPVAICLDYLGSMSKSVTVFNKRLNHKAQGVDEASDWPWRYAKMCSSVSDWSRHELVVHLTETHLVEEAIIVAAQRSFPDSHIICQLLRPHWFKTLSLNFLARLTLVPVFIEKVAPIQVRALRFSSTMVD